jgi:hypothetical protein
MKYQFPLELAGCGYRRRFGNIRPGKMQNSELSFSLIFQ